MIIQYKIVRKIGELPQIGKGYVKQLNLVEWDGHAAKYDLRPWNGDRCGKGITLTGEELEALLGILKKMEEE